MKKSYSEKTLQKRPRGQATDSSALSGIIVRHFVIISFLKVIVMTHLAKSDWVPSNLDYVAFLLFLLRQRLQNGEKLDIFMF